MTHQADRLDTRSIVDATATRDTDAALAVTGVVIVGDQRGRTLGFPTANIRLGAEHEGLVDGVYYGTVSADGLTDHPAAVSIGRRATFYNEGIRLLEAHLLDCDRDLYGVEATVELHRVIRPQVRFDDVQDLIGQLHDDVAQVRTWHA